MPLRQAIEQRAFQENGAAILVEVLGGASAAFGPLYALFAEPASGRRRHHHHHSLELLYLRRVLPSPPRRAHCASRESLHGRRIFFLPPTALDCIALSSMLVTYGVVPCACSVCVLLVLSGGCCLWLAHTAQFRQPHQFRQLPASFVSRQQPSAVRSPDR